MGGSYVSICNISMYFRQRTMQICCNNSPFKNSSFAYLLCVLCLIFFLKKLDVSIISINFFN